MYGDNEQTIIACSSGTITNSAIGIIRISGIEFLNSINCFFNIDLIKIKPRYATFCKLIEEEKGTIDEVVLTYFKGPNSYNGQDVLEISVHGNQINISRIIYLFLTVD